MPCSLTDQKSTRTQEVAQAPYIPPYVKVDTELDMAVLQLRDSDTGDVVRQIPSEQQIEAYQRAKENLQMIRKEDANAPQAAPQDAAQNESPNVTLPDFSAAANPAPQQPQQPATVSFNEQI